MSIEYKHQESWVFQYNARDYVLSRLDPSAFEEVTDRLHVTCTSASSLSWVSSSHWIDACLTEDGWTIVERGSFDGFARIARDTAADELLQYVTRSPLPWNKSEVIEGRAPPPVPFAVHFGETIAAQLFAEFQLEQNRGPSFTWDRFPDMVAGSARTSLFCHWPSGKPGAEAEREAAEAARGFARSLLKCAGL